MSTIVCFKQCLLFNYYGKSQIYNIIIAITKYKILMNNIIIIYINSYKFSSYTLIKTLRMKSKIS